VGAGWSILVCGSSAGDAVAIAGKPFMDEWLAGYDKWRTSDGVAEGC